MRHGLVGQGCACACDHVCTCARAHVFVCVCQHIHGAHVWVKAGEHDATLAGLLQNAGQDDVQERVHVEIR